MEERGHHQCASRDARVRDRMDAQAPVLGEGNPQAPYQALLGTSTLSPCSPAGTEGLRPLAE